MHLGYIARSTRLQPRATPLFSSCPLFCPLLGPMQQVSNCQITLQLGVAFDFAKHQRGSTFIPRAKDKSGGGARCMPTCQPGLKVPPLGVLNISMSELATAASELATAASVAGTLGEVASVSPPPMPGGALLLHSTAALTSLHDEILRFRYCINDEVNSTKSWCDIVILKLQSVKSAPPPPTHTKSYRRYSRLQAHSVTATLPSFLIKNVDGNSHRQKERTCAH